MPEKFSESAADEGLRKENEELRQQLLALRGSGASSSYATVPQRRWRPSTVTVIGIGLTVSVVMVIVFFTGYIPRQKLTEEIVGEAQERELSLPRVEVVTVEHSSNKNELQLPGNIQAITEAPILARADGYIERRMVDIGDRVRAGQPLAEIEAPELDEHVRQSRANLQQAQAALEQAIANLEQGKSDLELAQITAQRWSSLLARGVVSKQENDQIQAQYRAKVANAKALEKAVSSQRSGIAAAEANTAALEKMQSYRIVRAPFDGVITLRNVDAGALVSVGSTMLFRVAQTSSLRIYLNVPQTYANSVHEGEPAVVKVTNLPGRSFNGNVARTANALDPNSRTLLVEVQVPNAENVLFPGMYAQVTLTANRTSLPLMVPSDALLSRAEGTQVALIQSDRTVHLQRVEVGRDYGDRLEILDGLPEKATIIANPGEIAQEGIKVEPVFTH